MCTNSYQKDYIGITALDFMWTCLQMKIITWLDEAFGAHMLSANNFESKLSHV